MAVEAEIIHWLDSMRMTNSTKLPNGNTAVCVFDGENANGAEGIDFLDACQKLMKQNNMGCGECGGLTAFHRVTTSRNI